MNPDHENLCSSPDWAAYLQSDVLPAVTAGIGLGDDMLEIGPGPGAATAWLRERVARLTALESDPEAAARLAARHPDGNVAVDTGDATLLPYADESFDSVGSFTMLHHVPDAAAQYRILTEALRVLRPGGTLVGSDSLASDGLHHFHADDTYNPVDPATMLVWLRALGFSAVTITVDEVLKFAARKPRPDEAADDPREP
ncbi:MAG TPA: class I SAM-dependent methyltransferase [Streptosporangiaceae bacterium]|nr:class I SAM-dependent methyltransferase [Streptosporangiaceae bacterium]